MTMIHLSDSNNVCNAIKMYWDDGYEETINRTK